MSTDTKWLAWIWIQPRIFLTPKLFLLHYIIYQWSIPISISTTRWIAFSKAFVNASSNFFSSMKISLSSPRIMNRTYLGTFQYFVYASIEHLIHQQLFLTTS